MAVRINAIAFDAEDTFLTSAFERRIIDIAASVCSSCAAIEVHEVSHADLDDRARCFFQVDAMTRILPLDLIIPQAQKQYLL